MQLADRLPTHGDFRTPTPPELLSTLFSKRSPLPPMMRSAGVAASVLALAACTGTISAPGGSGAGSQPAGPVPVTSVPAGVPVGANGQSYEALTPTAAAMSRLTTEQYRNALRDVFGAGITLRKDLERDETSALFLSMGASTVATSPYGVEQYKDAALDVADQVFAQVSSFPQLVSCQPAAATDACVADFVRHFGSQLWRRPMTDGDVGPYVAIVGANGNTPDMLKLGMKYALSTLLQSANFVYRIPVGEVEAATGALRYTSQDMASRLSYFLWNSVPDAELGRAAAMDLTSTSAIETQARRMLSDPRARAAVTGFFGELWKVNGLTPDSKDVSVFPKWSAELLSDYKEEFRRFLESVAFDQPTDLRALFDGRTTFANGRLASTYGLGGQGGADFVPTVLDESRSGLLTSGAVMAATAKAVRSSPTERGVWVLENLLCEHVPPPPANVVVELKDADHSLTVREQLTAHRENPACASCHALFDPLGLPLESFDGIGLYRTQDNGKPIDTSGDWQGTPLAGARDLATQIAQDPRAYACMAKQLFAYASGHEPGAGENGAVAAISDAFTLAGRRYQDLIVQVVTSPAFRYLSKPE